MTTTHSRRDPGDILALGFGTTVAMWGLGYVLRMPGAAVPAPLLLAIVLGVAILGGFGAGRWTPRGVRGGLYVGLLAGGLNLLIVGSLLSGRNPNEIVPSALWYVPGSLAATAALTVLGAFIGACVRAARANSQPSAHAADLHTDHQCWPARFASVTLTATLILISAGGLVTSHDAGLAVPDWPNSFGYFMFLYPLSRMTGGVYYEHAHRLFGSLVGLTTVVFAIYLLSSERRGWVKGLAFVAVGVVVVQGLLGALRVTGKLTLETDPAAMAPNIVLAMIHAVLAQVFFSLLVTLQIVLDRAWTSGVARVAERHPTTIDRPLNAGLIVLILVQTALGAALRHVDWGLYLHITLAVFVVLLAAVVGFRMSGLSADCRPLPRFGTLLIWIAGIQIALGIAALVVTRFAPAGAVSKSVEAAVATAHQTLGALLLANAVAVWLWHVRMVAMPTRRGVPLQA